MSEWQVSGIMVLVWHGEERRGQETRPVAGWAGSSIHLLGIILCCLYGGS